jgi:hypothetical protein
LKLDTNGKTGSTISCQDLKVTNKAAEDTKLKMYGGSVKEEKEKCESTLNDSLSISKDFYVLCILKHFTCCKIVSSQLNYNHCI